MAKTYRKVTISISNAELNRFEDFLILKVKLNAREKKLAKDTMRKIWKRLVKSWDKKKK